MVDTTQTTTEKKLTQSDIRGVFLRSNLFQGSWNSRGAILPLLERKKI